MELLACKAGVFWSAPQSWTLILPESWDESKTDFKGEVDGLVFFFAFQDGGRDQRPPSLR